MFNIVIFILTLVSSGFILFIAVKNKQYPGALSLIIFSLAVAVAAAANFYLYLTPSTFQSIWFAVTTLSMTIGFTAILTFVIEYTRHSAWLKPARLVLLAVEPVLTQILFWTNPGGQFFSRQFEQGLTYTFSISNPWLLVNTIYTNSLLLSAIFLLTWDFRYRSLVFRNQAKFILAGFALCLLVNNNFSASNYALNHSWGIIPLLTAGIAIISGFIYAGLIDITPIARESVVEYMNDGWIVLDQNLRILDINTAAEKIIGLSAKKLAGQPAEKIFVNWPNLMKSLTDTREMDFKGSVNINNKWIYLNTYISPLVDANSKQIGKLIVWRDITERRRADEARQQARDGMFILLHSITSAASRALNLDDFLSESIYQIVASSQSQSIAVFLLEEHENNPQERYLTMVAQHGLPLAPDTKMISIPASLEFVAWVLERGEPLLIPNTTTDERIPAPMRSLSPMALLVIPLMREGQVLGILSVARSGGSTYNAEEIARLSAVTDEVATFIQSNRQRQLSIALAERQRLVRDLHDSVTQELYGLVQLAEATQAGIHAGIIDMPARVIDHMAETARQALKEMRLFLFQMQPVDLERDGLVDVLQNRLSSVEGRTEIHAQLIADEIIPLPMDKILALYYITQEALNNVLKHARAKNVSVHLQNRKSNFVLEVKDDGCGFDLDKIASGGIGLKSIRERALQIGGKLKISSAPGKGTRITVTLTHVGSLDER